jgi:uncharacterized integral membrane protein
MAFGYLVVAILAAAVATFALQNSEPVTIHFLFWSFRPLPIAGVTLAAVAVGLIVVGVPLGISRRRWRVRSRGLEARVGQLETSLAERERAEQERVERERIERARAAAAPPPPTPPRPSGTTP